MVLRKTALRAFRLPRLLWLPFFLWLAGAAGTSSRAQDAVFGSASGPGSLFADPAAPAPSSPVLAELIADVTAIAPGRPFHLGVRFLLQPGWHVYWINAGDAGQATRIDWALPPGFTAEPLQWPLPSRIDQDGLVSYGYQDAVLLFATVHPPATLPPAPVKFSASTSWIACKDSCIPGDAKVELTLPAAASAAPAPAAAPQAVEFARAAAQVPVVLAQPQTDRMRIEFSPSPLLLEPGRAQRFEVAVHFPGPWVLDAAPSAVAPPAANPAAKPALYPVSRGSIETSHPQLLAATPQLARFSWPVTVARDAKSSGSQLQAYLRLPLVNPASGEHQLAAVSVAVPVGIAPPAAPPVAAPAAAVPAAVPSAPAATPAAGQTLSFLKPGVVQQFPLWELLLYAFLGGLILNVMPCVLPVLSLKVLAFVRQAGEDRRRIFHLGLAYTLGVLLSFAALAGGVIALRVAGVQVGQGFQLQDPRFVAIMAAIVLALALSLLGVYTIELPGSAVGRMDEVARREGLLGAMFSGMLSTALATPCTAPYLGTALGFAFTQPPAVVLVFFLLTGLGLAAPYLLLSLNPGWLRFLPRPGRWMLIFEQLMGFVLLGFMIWLLSILGTQAGAGFVATTLAFLQGVAFACWMIGVAAKSRLNRPKWACCVAGAVAIAAIAFYVFPERYLRDFRPETGMERAVAALPGAGEIPWEPFSVARTEQLVKEGRTVFVDFTADWCLTCKVNEHGTLATAQVRDLFARAHVAALKADWTARDQTIGRVLAQFGRAGVPCYVIFPAGHPDRPRILPTLLTPSLLQRELAPDQG